MLHRERPCKGQLRPSIIVVAGLDPATSIEGVRLQKAMAPGQLRRCGFDTNAKRFKLENDDED
jgi:hypothetical protein